jgi:hypothetical protein
MSQSGCQGCWQAISRGVHKQGLSAENRQRVFGSIGFGRIRLSSGGAQFFKSKIEQD